MQHDNDMIDQLDAMRMGVDYTMTIDCRQWRLNVRPLSISEVVEVTHHVAAEIRGKLEFQQNALTEQTLYARFTLEKATTDSSGAPRLTGYMFDKMTPDEIMHLFKQYVACCDRVNPGLEDLDKDEVFRCADMVKKNPSAAIELSFMQLVSLVRYWATNDG